MVQKRCGGRLVADMTHPLCAGNAGFSLVEILVAIFIFVIVLASIYGAYSSTFRLVGVTRNQAEVYQMARIAMERISEDLVAAAPSPQQGEEVTADVHSLIGVDEDTDGRAADSLRFWSRAQLSFAGADAAPGELTVISYTVQSAEDGGGLILFRKETPFEQAEDDDESSPGFILCDHLAAVNFTYFDEAGESYDSWDSTSEQFQGRFPARVGVELDFWEAGVDSPLLRFRTALALVIGGNRERE